MYPSVAPPWYHLYMEPKKNGTSKTIYKTKIEKQM